MVKSEYFYTRFEEGNGNPLQYSCQENLMDRGPWRGATVHRIAKRRTRLKRLSTQHAQRNGLPWWLRR